jgi:hypothetical protein
MCTVAENGEGRGGISSATFRENPPALAEREEYYQFESLPAPAGSSQGSVSPRATKSPSTMAQRNGDAMELESIKHEFIVHIGTHAVHFHQPLVPAREILTRGGAEPPEEYQLEALNGPRGQAVAQFETDEKVDLRQDDRKFFRAVPRGGGRS